MDDHILEAQALNKHFATVSGELRILRDVDFTIRRGEFVAVTGASGVGKSTLLHLLGGLDTPTAGALTVAGQRIDSLAETELSAYRNKKCGFVFQHHYLLEEFDAVENVMMPLLVRGEKRNNCEAVAVKLLTEVGLGERLHHRPTQLSGGECQRVAVARAMAGAPEILIADEPTGNLDHETAATIHELLADLNRQKHMTIVVATHDLSLAARAQKRYRLSDGQLTRLD